MLMKTDTLQDSLEKYRAKIAGSARNRAAYELALASGRNYRPGDQISYYIKTTLKKVPAYEAAKLASEFDPENRDENVDYYVAKLDDLVKKFRTSAQRHQLRAGEHNRRITPAGRNSRAFDERRLEVSAERRASIRRCRARSRIRSDAGDIGEHALDDRKSASRCR